MGWHRRDRCERVAHGMITRLWNSFSPVCLASFKAQDMSGLMSHRASTARLLLWMLALLLGIAGANPLSIHWYGARGYELDVGARFDPELQFLDGFFQPERDETTQAIVGVRHKVRSRCVASFPRPIRCSLWLSVVCRRGRDSLGGTS